MPSRRELLSTLGGAATVALAGCSGSATGGSGTVDCHTGALEHGDGDLLNGGASATVEDGDVRLAVPLAVDEVREQGVDAVEAYDASGSLAFAIPVSADDVDRMANKRGVNEGQLRYEQYLGERPVHGRYRVVAVDGAGEAVDTVTVEFNCFPDADE